MIKVFETNVDCVTAARQRIINIFESNSEVQMSISGGKDSICLSDLVFKLCQSGRVDKSKLVIDFIDEEAIFPCVERVVKHLRTQWLSIGVPFRWWCIQVKHYNCFNQLSNDETFICWDETKRDVWIRERPPFAITEHPLLVPRKMNYQTFLPIINKHKCQMIGIRTAESIQRRMMVAMAKSTVNAYPIYDWKDKDVLLYIKENNLEIPEAYLYMYQLGRSRGQMRISQFFSIDTAKILVNMGEYYPHLFDKICRREPNAYMAMLYYDTEMFRHEKAAKGKKDKEKEPEKDYKKLALDLIGRPELFMGTAKENSYKQVKRLIVNNGSIMNAAHWKQAYNILLAGDPKRRSVRALSLNICRDAAGRR